MTKTRRRWWLLGTLGFLCLCLYFRCVHRYRLSADAAGWAADVRILPFQCVHCTGRVVTFTFDGKPVPLPRWPEENARLLRLDTPVGVFEVYSSELGYRSHGVHRLHFPEAGEPLSAEEV